MTNRNMNNTELSLPRAPSPASVEAPEARPKRLVPLAAKAGFTAFLCVMIPIYLRDYGPTNFLYFCDVALLLALVGIWTESALLIGMCSVGILLPQFLWLADFGAHVLGFKITGMTNYMFDARKPLFTRGLSLFHGWFPLLLVWLLGKVGYDKRALPAWTALSFVLILVCHLFLPGAGAHLPDPNIPVNINYVNGFNDDEPQRWMNPNLYAALWFCALALFAYVPTHCVLRKVCRAPKST